MSNKYPSIDSPNQTPVSLQNSILQLKENVETLNGTRRGSSPAVTWDDLVRLGLARIADIPK